MSQPVQELSTILVHATLAIAADYRRQGRWQDAVDLLTSATIVEADAAKIGELKVQLADILINWAGYETARDHLNDARVIAQEQGHRRLLSGVLYYLGEVHYHLRLLRKESSMKTALDFHVQALELREATKQMQESVESLSRLGIIHAHQGQEKDALLYFEKAIERAGELGYTAGVHRPLLQLASRSQRNSDMDKALEQFHQALLIAEDDGDAERLLFSKGDLGQHIYMMTKNPGEALPLLKDALEIAKITNHRLGTWVMAMRLGDVHTAQRDHATASKFYGTAHRTAQTNRLVVLAENADIKFRAAASKASNG